MAISGKQAISQSTAIASRIKSGQYFKQSKNLGTLSPADRGLVAVTNCQLYVRRSAIIKPETND